MRSFLLFGLLALSAVAQQQNSGSNSNNNDDNDDNTTQARTTARVTQAQQTAARATTASAAATTARGTQLSGLPNLSSTPSSSRSIINFSNAPSISTSVAQFILTGGLPTIAGVGIPTMVIPYTADAPFKQQSSLPEGTVFIIVGAILGFMGMCILAWRGLVAWSLHRSVQKAARAGYDNNNNDSKTLLANTSKPGVYGMTTLGGASNMSIDTPGGLRSVPGGRLSKTVNSMPAVNTNVSRNSSLFFSPTAGVGNSAGGMGTPGNRSSNFLPAGYYTTASAISPAAGASVAHLGNGHPSLLNLNPMGPTRAGYAPQRNASISPPESPALHARPSGDSMQRSYNNQTPVSYQQGAPPRRGSGAHMYAQHDVSHLNLHTPGGNINGGRAPSANLEELFDSRGNRY